MMNPLPPMPSLAKETRLDDPFTAAGDRAYLVGAQSGRFPPIGHHLPGRMGGLWAHPHKLLDGFWCAVQWADQGTETDQFPTRGRLLSADRFESFPWGVRQWFDLPAEGLRVCRTLIVPDGIPGLIVDLTFSDIRGEARTLDVAFLAVTDLRPGWSSFEDPEPTEHDRAAVDTPSGTIVARNPTHTWAVAWGSLQQPIQASTVPTAGAPDPGAERGAAGVQHFQLALPAHGQADLRLGILSVDPPLARAADALHDFLRQTPSLIAAKQQRLADTLGRSRLETPDPHLDSAWIWTHCAYDWLTRDVPGVGRGLGAGIPDYPWWFSCDTAYALRGLLPLGDFATAEQTLRLLAAASERANPSTGRIIHELTCTDQVVNPGNTQETPQFAFAVLETYLWSGNRGLIEDLYPLCRQGVLSWTLGACDSDGDLLPEGYGITEVAGLNAELIDSSVWAHEGVRAVGRMATLLGDDATAAHCAAIAPRLRAAIEARFWLPEERLHADLIAAPGAVHARLERMLRPDGQKPGRGTAMIAHLELLQRRAQTLPQDEEVAWYFANAVINVPLEAGLSTHDRAVAALERMETPEFLGPSGVYLNGISQGAAMSLTTSVLTAAEVAYGRIDQAVRLCRLLADQVELRMPGAISEMSPDGGCFVQAWSGYGAVYPLACGVFGLFPDAGARHVVLAPTLPAGWPGARLSDVRVGEALLSLELTRSDEDRTICRVGIDQPGWRVTLLPPLTEGAEDFVARTALSIHAAASDDGWGIARAVLAGGKTVDLTAAQVVELSI